MPHTSRNRLLVLGVVTSLLLIARVHSAGAADQPARILNLSWTIQGDATSITTKLSAPVRYRTATSATTIAVDLWTVASGGDRAVTPDRGITSSLSLQQMTPDVARLGITLREPGRFKVYLRDDRLTVVVFPMWQSAVPLPPSVAYRTLQVSTGAGRARAHVVTLDPQSQSLNIQPALGGAVISANERTSTAAARLEALVAINGNFYTGYSGIGLPVGLIVIDGRVLAEPIPRRPVFAIDAKGRPWIGTVTFSGRLLADGGTAVPITAVNRPPYRDGVALYTPEFGPLTLSQALVAIVRADRIVTFSSGRPVIPPDGYALAVPASQQHLLLGFRRGQSVKLELALSPAGIQHAIQGGPQLVRDGQILIPYAWEGFGPGFTYIRTARSAIGITKQGKLLLVTIDRRSRDSSGMSLPEVAALMLDLGARDAMNLDGGGSTTLVVGGRVVSALPVGGERTVSSVLVALRRPTERSP